MSGSVYPANLDSFSTSHQDNVNEVIHAADINNLADAVNKIEGALGTYPVLTPTAVKTSAYSANPGDLIPVDTTSGAVTITLPNAPIDKTRIAVQMVTQSGTNAVTIAASGSDVFDKLSGSTTLTLKLLNQGVLLHYAATNKIWYAERSLSLTQLDLRYPVSSITSPNNGDLLQYNSSAGLWGNVNGGSLSSIFNVKQLYGAKGDGVTDDTVAIQNAINAVSAAGGGIVLFPEGIYAIASTITIPTKVSLLGSGSAVDLNAGAAGLTWSPVSGLKWIGALHGTMCTVSGPAKIEIRRLGFDGANAADYGLHFDQLQASVIEDVGVQKCLVDHIWLGTTSSTVGANSHHNRFASIFVLGQNSFGSAIRLTGNAGKTANACINTFERLILIYGKEGLYLDDADSNEFIGAFCYPQAGASYAVHFAPDARQNRFLGLTANSGGIYVDTPSNAAYSNLILDYDRSNGEPEPTLNTGAKLDYWETGLNGLGLTVENAVKSRINALAYSASITPDLSGGPWQTITVTNAAAFTVNAPANPPNASHTAELTVEVFNNSGGAMGAITWNAAFVFNGFVWANPASTKKRFARFEWNGTAWICTALSGADY